MEKINIAELLKDCPKGMELDCTMYDDVTFNRLQGNEYIIINRGYNGGEVHLTKFGQMFNGNDAKCVIFPKGKTTWEGFTPPIEFKDGDIIYICNEESNGTFTYVAILKQIEKGGEIKSHCFYNYEDAYFSPHNYLFYNHNTRFATEEEKAKLFQAIKDNGYKWNQETKTLEKLVKPKFKVGDRVKLKNSRFIFTITDLLKDRYRATIDSRDLYEIEFERQDAYILVPNKFDINTLKPFDKVLVRSEKHHIWFHSFFGLYNKDLNTPFICCNGFEYTYCIPYKGNEHLLGTTNDCDDFYKTWKK